MSPPARGLPHYVAAALLAAVWLTYVVMHSVASTDRPATHSTQRGHARRPGVKYILQWRERISPFDLIPEGYGGFTNAHCHFNSCFVTADKHYFADITGYDAILFNGKELTKPIDIPERRLSDQIYIFLAAESAHNYRVCDRMYENFFNWTWTYRLDSDVRWLYVTIYDLKGRVVGPKKEMVWPKLDPISEELKNKLSSKTKGAAWFVSNCKTAGKRETFFDQLKTELAKLRYDWTIDVYGYCGTKRCPRKKESQCHDIVRKYYHFYLAFENSFSEDYVTEKLLTALNHDAVPVVFGGANYSRFLPPGSYLDARELGAKKLLETMNEIIHDKQKYFEFFRWRNHFQYKYTMESDDLCSVCAALHSRELLRRHTSYADFRQWWNDGQWRARGKCKQWWQR